MIKRVYVIPLNLWYISDDCKIERQSRNGEMANVPTISIIDGDEVIFLDASHCIIVEEVHDEEISDNIC